MKIYIVPKYILPLGYGLAFYKWALVREDAEDIAYVKAHEWCHLLQWKELGFVGFIYRYGKELIDNGYEYNALEVDARRYGRIHKDKFKD